jgi:hypothetical protein
MIFNYSAASVAGASVAGASGSTGVSTTGASTFSSFTSSLTSSFTSAFGASKVLTFLSKSESLFSAVIILLSLASFQILSLI